MEGWISNSPELESTQLRWSSRRGSEETSKQYTVLSLSKDLGSGRLTNSRSPTEIRTCLSILAVRIAAFAAMTRLLQRSPPRERVSRRVWLKLPLVSTLARVVVEQRVWVIGEPTEPERDIRRHCG